MTDRLTPSAVLKKLQDNQGVSFAEVFRHGSLQVEIYKPDGADYQTPHTRDEVYVVISGSGQFINGDTRQPFEAGEVLFVPAGVVHRFEDFTDDFATWVFFYGPEGGEAPTEPRITLHPHNRRIQVTIGDTLLADTTRAIELRERGYPPCQYIPRDDVRMELLTRSDTVTHCPFKGDAAYFSHGEHTDVAWSYEEPLADMQAIAQHMAFDDKKVTVG
ncbi:DUF427 domain-containing protein [Halomonas sp. BC04]|uniref:DUF427 domain-containing protein n=1 Tax=Halomonas sp. BC04 TaxID=1403540 RepID=UPI0003ED6FD0|nr:DUF427 domain-containing protein [Halomonas sp. BC04]EWG98212.1 hypothetical protein Q427_31710 [Halomonas sp. BC04]